MKKEQFNAISKWQTETFGEATALSKMAHLEEELGELKNELVLWHENEELMEPNKLVKEREFADCFILLFGSAASDGMSYEDICNCIEEKMQVNYKRKWGSPNEDGVVYHIKDKEPESIENVCECRIPYFPTGDTHWCSKCNRITVY